MGKVFVRLIWFFSLIFIILFSWYIIRFFSSTELDDVHPAIPCDINLMHENDVLWVIPLYDNDSIALHKEWCAEIKALNKTLGLHGVYHTYREFGEMRDSSYIKEGIAAFESCFGYKPKLFKAPQVFLNGDMREVLTQEGLSVKNLFNQRLHKVYHCNDSGQYSNSLVNWL